MIKIDRSFVSNIVDSVEAAALVHTLIQLGKALGLRSVAEGVETDGQRTKLMVENADYAQGFLYARPLTPADVEVLARMPQVPNGPGGVHSSLWDSQHLVRGH
jgi:EAL domain-containing protein (putative c-di-GMP-specific phosphodiesterase class I)